MADRVDPFTRLGVGYDRNLGADEGHCRHTIRQIDRIELAILIKDKSYLT